MFENVLVQLEEERKKSYKEEVARQLLEAMEIPYSDSDVRKVRNFIFEERNEEIKIPTEENNNEVFIIGTLKYPFRFGYVYKGEKYYTSFILIKCDEGVTEVPIKVTTSAVENIYSFKKGNSVILTGKCIARRNGEGYKRIEVSVDKMIENKHGSRDISYVYIEGRLIKEAETWKRKLGMCKEFAIKAESACLPCYSLDLDNKVILEMEKDNHIKLSGHIQSRRFFWKKGKEYRSVLEILVDEIINLDKIDDEVDVV